MNPRAADWSEISRQTDILVQDAQEEAAQKHVTPSRAKLQKSMARIARVANKSIDPTIAEFIPTMEYPKILIGSYSMTNPHHMLKNRGKLNAREKQFFDHFNKIVTHPVCIAYAVEHWKENSTLDSYETHIQRYLRYFAEHTKHSVQNFSVDGTLMLECMKFYIDNPQLIEGNRKVTYGSTPTFKAALTYFYELLGAYNTKHLTNPVEVVKEMERKWTKIECISVLDSFYRTEQRKAHKSLLSLYPNKDRAKLFQKKYTIADAIIMMKNMLKASGSSEKAEIYRAINAQLSFLLGHHLLFRGNNKSKLELSDAVYSVEETAHGTVPILGFQFLTGKTMNPKSEPGLSGVCRNKDVEICLLSAFAFSLWYRFDFGDDYAPLYHAGKHALNFMDKTRWYDPKILFSTHKNTVKMNKPVSEGHMQELAKKCFASIGFKSYVNQHAGRKTNSSRADAFGVSESQIRRAGRWNLDVLQKRYISSYAQEFIHYSGGFKPEEPYFIPRNIDVPESLQKQIFPWLEHALEMVLNRDDQECLSKLDRDGTAPKFLEMLGEFRSIILQDLALLSEIVPDSIYSKHPITRDPEFIQFKESVKKAVSTSSLFNDIPGVRQALDTLVPPIAEKINFLKAGIEILNQNNQKTMSEYRKAIESQERCFSEQLIEIKEIRSEIHRISYNQNAFAYRFAYASASKDDVANLSGRIDKMEEGFNMMKDQMATLIRLTTNISLQNPSTRLPSVSMEENGHRIITTQAIEHMAFAEEASESNPPTKKRKRSQNVNSFDDPPFDTPEFDLKIPETILELVDDYYISRPGKPSIFERNEHFKARWRLDNFRFNEHKKIKCAIKIIEKIQEETKLETREASRLLEEYRLQKKLTTSNLLIKIRGSKFSERVLQGILNSWKEGSCQ